MYSAFLISKSECLTCNNQVLKTLGTLQGIFEVEIDRIEGRIVVSHTDEVSREQIQTVLLTMGFTVIEKAEQEKVETDEPSLCGCSL